MKTYVFDIDGTICYLPDDTVDNDYSNSIPLLERIKKVNELYDTGNTVIYQTARGMGRHRNTVELAVSGFYDITKNQLDAWGCKYHSLFLGKPAADFYIDDKGINVEDFFTN